MKPGQNLVDAAKIVVKLLDMGFPIARGGAVHMRLKNEIKWFEEGECDPIDDAITKLDKYAVDVDTALDLHDIAESDELTNEEKTRLHSAINAKLDRG